MIYINDPNTGILLCNLNITPKVWTQMAELKDYAEILLVLFSTKCQNACYYKNCWNYQPLNWASKTCPANPSGMLTPVPI